MKHEPHWRGRYGADALYSTEYRNPGVPSALTNPVLKKYVQQEYRKMISEAHKGRTVWTRHTCLS